MYTEKLPGATAHDYLFYRAQELLCRAVHERRITQRNKTNKGLRLATPGNSWQLLATTGTCSVLIGLKAP